MALLTFCNSPVRGLFKRNSAHELYSQRIIDAGLRETALGRLWFLAAEQGLKTPLNISIPYNETGYFAAERPRAAGLQFSAKRGEKLSISLDKKPATDFSVYLDLWEATEPGIGLPKLLAAADTTGKVLEYEVRNDGMYIIRIQPELLKSGEYTLTISTGPSLAFPIPSQIKSNIGSFWGVGRDRGARRHEGIDIFAAFRSPVVASAEGIVTQANENNLGGKVVFLRPKNKDYTLYYAHLDTQLVLAGQMVYTGDTLGLVGNTGNAKTTAPHLHFGIYGNRGAIDPLSFVNPIIKNPARISASLINLGKQVRNNNKTDRLYSEPNIQSTHSLLLERNTLMLVEAATESLYKIMLPNGQRGFINSKVVNTLNNSLSRSQLKNAANLLDQPDSMAARKTQLHAGETINILAGFDNFFFIRDKNNQTGWIEKRKPSFNPYFHSIAWYLHKSV